MAARGFLAQNALQDVFAFARRQVVEEILRRHLDEPEPGKVSVEATEKKVHVQNPIRFYFFYLSV